MGRSPCCEKSGLKKGPWTPEEDQKLLSYIEEHGHGCWRSLPAKAGLQRCGKSCRLRWTNYLRPDIKRGKFSVQEEQTIIQLHALLGNRWSAIASHLPKRTDNEIKNFWNTHLKKRLANMGIDPVTHKPQCDALSSTAADVHASKTASNLSHMAQWENARLEAEARLVRESKLLRVASSASQAATDGGAAGTCACSSATTTTSTSTPPFQLLSSTASLPIELHNALPAGVPSANATPPCFDVLGEWQGVGTSKMQVTGPVRGGQSNRDVKIDLESPTSPSSFSESILTAGAIGVVDHRSSCSAAGRQLHADQILDGDGEGEGRSRDQEVDWGCFPKAMQLLDSTRDRCESFVAAAAFSTVDCSTAFGADNASSWLHESLKTGPASAAAAAASAVVGHFGDGFTEMLLNNSDEHNSPDVVAGSRSKGNGEDEEEKYKSYWNSILNLVSSAPASNPPDCVLV